MRRAISVVVLVSATLTVLGVAPAAGASTIDFDTDAYGATIKAPTLFRRTHPLGNLYRPLGVRFHGVKPRVTGGAILNERSGFGVDARSGRNFLAFNRSTYAKDPEIVELDSLQRRVAISTGYGGSGDLAFSMTAFRGDRKVDRDEVSVAGGSYSRLRVASDKGINRVVIRADRSRRRAAFVLDDLSFAPIRYS